MKYFGVLAAAAAAALVVGSALHNAEGPTSRTLNPRPIRAGRAPAVCFAPGTPDAEIEFFSSAMLAAWGPQPRFQITGRWPSSSQSPGPLGPGDPITLSYSFVPDGTPIPDRIGFTGQSNLFAFMNVLYGSPDVWQPLFAQVFARWGQLCGVTFVYEPADDGSQLNSILGQPGMRGDIRIAGMPLNGPGGILGYTGFPSDGDIVLDTADTFFNDIANNSLKLRNVVSHEAGHALGLLHTCPLTQTILMEPVATTAFDGPQHDDIRAAQWLYGDPSEPDNTPQLSRKIGTLVSGTTVNLGTPPSPPAVNAGSTLSIDAPGEQDWFKFSILSLSRLNVTVTPIGIASYDNSAQSCSGNPASCCSNHFINSLTFADLTLQIFGPDGTTAIASAPQAPLGQPRSITDLQLPGPSVYYIRVSCANAPTQSQLYHLSVSSVGLDCNNNGIADALEILLGAPDCDGNLLPDDCQVPPICPNCADCQADGIPDICQLPPICPTCQNCNANNIPDDCELDCDANSVPDDCDLETGAVDDCNSNNIPDRCETDPAICGAACLPDCDANFVPDSCQLAGIVIKQSPPLHPISSGNPQSYHLWPAPQATSDVTLEFEAIADLGGSNEYVDIKLGDTPVGSVFIAGADCPWNPSHDTLIVPAAVFNAAIAQSSVDIHMIPSEFVDLACDTRNYIQVRVTYTRPDDDCNQNNWLDVCELAAGISPDCNANYIPDSCDIAAGTLIDADQNGAPDECQCHASCLGDVNGDGAINGDDVAAFIACLSAASTFNTPCACADTNGDTRIDAADAALFVEMLLQNPTAACP